MNRANNKKNNRLHFANEFPYSASNHPTGIPKDFNRLDYEPDQSSQRKFPYPASDPTHQICRDMSTTAKFANILLINEVTIDIPFPFLL